MKLTIVLLLALVAVALAAPHHSKARRAFQKFKVQHGKNYVSADEESMRFRIFKANMRRVHKMNQDHRAIGGDNVFGVTQFMDLTPSEFSHMYLMPHRPLPIKQPHQIMDPSEIPTVPELPTYWDWRYNATGGVSAPGVSAVKNQGQCGSCWAFSATEQIESMNYIQKVTPKINILSEQQIVDCCTQAYGCNGGWTYVAYEYIESAGGQDTESSYPYTARNGQCQFSPSNVADDISSWKYVTQSDNVDAMMNYLASSGPLSICVDASSWQFYNGGVLKSCGQQIDHCVQLAGFSTVSGTQAWNVRNSWGTSWGESGYIYIERGSNLCAIGDVVTTVTGKAVN